MFVVCYVEENDDVTTHCFHGAFKTQDDARISVMKFEYNEEEILQMSVADFNAHFEKCDIEKHRNIFQHEIKPKSVYQTVTTSFYDTVWVIYEY